MRASMAYFAGAGTVIAAIVVGVGGGLLIADMVSPKSPKQGVETTRLERRMAPEPIPANAPSPASNAPSEPVPYLAAPQLSAPNAAVAAVPAPKQTEPENSTSTAAKPADTATAPQPAAAAAQPATPAVQVAREQPAAADDAVAKARDADVKRATEKRRAERRPQWTERRRHQPRQDQELRAVEEKVREDTEPRRDFAAEPVRMERPRILLFGAE
jgi:hypothetical protein